MQQGKTAAEPQVFSAWAMPLCPGRRVPSAAQSLSLPGSAVTAREKMHRWRGGEAPPQPALEPSLGESSEGWCRCTKPVSHGECGESLAPRALSPSHIPR